MIRRLWHFWIIGHRWRVAWTHYNPGIFGKVTTYVTPNCEDSKQGWWGFTEIALRCDCGAFKRKRLIGDHAGIKDTEELLELERLAKLK